MQQAKGPKVVGKINIEDLLKKQDNIKAISIQNALAKHKAKMQEEEEAKVLAHLSAIQRNTELAVQTLKDARKREKKAKEYLTAVATAEQQFLVDANYDNYNAALRVAAIKYRGY